MFLFFFLEEIDFPSKHNVAPLYWSLPLSVFCERLRQIIVLSGHSLISLLFSLGEGISVQKETWNLDLAFWKQKLFRCEFKTICFWNLATPWLFFLEKRLFALVFGDIVFSESMSWGDFLFLWVSKWRAREKARGFVWEKLSLFEHSFYRHE